MSQKIGYYHQSYLFINLHIGYYRTASNTDTITLSDGRREMTDSEFGSGAAGSLVCIQLYNLYPLYKGHRVDGGLFL